METGDAATHSDAPATPASTSLVKNVPGQSAIIELLRLHDGAPARSPIDRLFGVAPLCTERRLWYDAALSEIEVGHALAGLGDGWTVLHALPVGAGTSDIDHVAIGPAGVFIVNTQNHTGQTVWASQRTFLVSGIRHPYIRNMEYEMGRAERLIGSAAGLPVEVTGILAIVAAKSITVREKHRDVTVLATENLVAWLRDRPAVLDAPTVSTIAVAAIRGTTWHHDASSPPRSVSPSHLEKTMPESDHGDRLLERFEAIRAEVRQAWLRQLAWVTIATIIGAGGFIFVTYSILMSTIGSLGRP